MRPEVDTWWRYYSLAVDINKEMHKGFSRRMLGYARLETSHLQRQNNAYTIQIQICNELLLADGEMHLFNYTDEWFV